MPKTILLILLWATLSASMLYAALMTWIEYRPRRRPRIDAKAIYDRWNHRHGSHPYDTMTTCATKQSTPPGLLTSYNRRCTRDLDCAHRFPCDKCEILT